MHRVPTSIRFRTLTGAGARPAFTSIAIGFPVAMPNGPFAACLGNYPSAGSHCPRFPAPDSIDPRSLHVPPDRDAWRDALRGDARMSRCAMHRIKAKRHSRKARCFFTRVEYAGWFMRDMRATPSLEKRSPDGRKKRSRYLWTRFCKKWTFHVRQKFCLVLRELL